MPSASASPRADRFAERAHLDGLGDSRQARQALRARRPGNDPELHFRLSHLRRRRHHAIVPRHRHFQAAAESLPWIAMTTGFGQSSISSSNGSRVRRGFSPADHFAEFADVRAGDKGASRADHDDGGDGRVGGRRFRWRRMPSGTPGLSAFTGGLSIVMTAISSWRVSRTVSLMSPHSLVIPRRACQMVNSPHDHTGSHSER